MNMETTQPRRGVPSHASCVFKGKIFEVWQWPQEMFDGTTQIFERIWRPPTVEIIATVGDNILIEEQDQPDRKDNINLPSGRADQSEDMLREAKRELLEETGYASDDWHLFRSDEPTGKVLHDSYYFIARNCKKVKEPELDAGERIRTKLITLDDFIMLSKEPRFWAAPEFVNYLLQVRYNPFQKEEFRKALFPDSVISNQ